MAVTAVLRNLGSAYVKTFICSKAIEKILKK